MYEIRVPLRFEGRLLIDEGDTSPRLVVLALHGYGSSPEVMLRLTRLTVGASPAILALQGPYQHYQNAPQAGAPTAPEAGYNWGIRHHHADAVQLHHELVLKSIDEARTRFSITPNQIVLLGFSQAVGLNYRFIGVNPTAIGGVVAICGGVPKDWETGPYQNVATPILHIGREDDEFFPGSIARGFETRLAARASNVELHVIPGTHRYPSKAAGIFGNWWKKVESNAVGTGG